MLFGGTSNKRCVWRWQPQPITATTGPAHTLARRLTSCRRWWTTCWTLFVFWTQDLLLSVSLSFSYS